MSFKDLVQNIPEAVLLDLTCYTGSRLGRTRDFVRELGIPSVRDVVVIPDDERVAYAGADRFAILDDLVDRIGSSRDLEDIYHGGDAKLVVLYGFAAAAVYAAVGVLHPSLGMTNHVMSFNERDGEAMWLRNPPMVPEAAGPALDLDLFIDIGKWVPCPENDEDASSAAPHVVVLHLTANYDNRMTDHQLENVCELYSPVNEPARKPAALIQVAPHEENKYLHIHSEVVPLVIARLEGAMSIAAGLRKRDPTQGTILVLSSAAPSPLNYLLGGTAAKCAYGFPRIDFVERKVNDQYTAVTLRNHS